jgi:hypothetical protein
MTADQIVQLRTCSVELYRDAQLVVTRFPDGTEAHAIPHDTDDYHEHARTKTGQDDPLLYCWQHDLMHAIWGELFTKVSVVLWALAHNQSTDTPECDFEEAEVQRLQRQMQMQS